MYARVEVERKRGMSQIDFIYLFFLSVIEVADCLLCRTWEQPPGCTTVRGLRFPPSDLLVIQLKLGLPRWCGGKESACQCRKLKRCGFHPPGWEDPLEEEMATHSSILAWEIPRRDEPGGLESMGLQGVGRD